MNAVSALEPALLPLGFIDGLGGMEMLLIFAVALMLFGGDKLPEFARGLGKVMREVKKAASGVEDEFRRAMDEDERKRLLAAPTAPGELATGSPTPAAATTATDAYSDYEAHTAAATPAAEGSSPAPATAAPETEAGASPVEGGPSAGTEPAKPAAKPAPASEDYP
ncbi:MAG: Sec-independent protein translocase subunit TatA/TatB [Opitutaceae bacterium]